MAKIEEGKMERREELQRGTTIRGSAMKNGSIGELSLPWYNEPIRMARMEKKGLWRGQRNKRGSWFGKQGMLT